MNKKQLFLSFNVQADVVAALEKVCDLYSSDIRAECKMFVKEYGSDIVDLLVNEISPDQVCSKLSLCAAQLTVRVSTKWINSFFLCQNVLFYWPLPASKLFFYQ